MEEMCAHANDKRMKILGIKSTKQGPPWNRQCRGPGQRGEGPPSRQKLSKEKESKGVKVSSGDLTMLCQGPQSCVAFKKAFL